MVETLPGEIDGHRQDSCRKRETPSRGRKKRPAPGQSPPSILPLRSLCPSEKKKLYCCGLKAKFPRCRRQNLAPRWNMKRATSGSTAGSTVWAVSGTQAL